MGEYADVSTKVKCREKIDKFLSFEEGWDSYGGDPTWIMELS